MVRNARASMLAFGRQLGLSPTSRAGLLALPADDVEGELEVEHPRRAPGDYFD
jgi:hypothetical protein